MIYMALFTEPETILQIILSVNLKMAFRWRADGSLIMRVGWVDALL